MTKHDNGEIIHFGNLQRGIILRCLNESENRYEIIYHQNNLKWVKQEMVESNEEWNFTKISGIVVRESEYHSYIQALNNV